MPLPALAPPKLLSDVLNDLVNFDLLKDILSDETIDEEKEQAQLLKVRVLESGQIEAALLKSNGGRSVIFYKDLPELWRNNEFILGGYRWDSVRTHTSL